MGWVFTPARETFLQYRHLWDELNHVNGNHPLLDAIFVAGLVRHFASERTVLGVRRDSGKTGMVLVEQPRFGLWETFQPSQAPLGLILFGDRANVAGQVDDLIRALPGYALGFAALQQDPEYSVFSDVALSGQMERLMYLETGRLSIQGTFADYWSSRGKDLVGNLARRQRRLDRQGRKWQFGVETHRDRVADCIQAYGKLEEEGWKANYGTAVTTANTQGAFYREILEAFCACGEGIVYQLLFDGKVVASQLCLQRGTALNFLKMAYDEACRDFSPGFWLRQEILKLLFAEKKIRTVEFYGKVREGWTKKWTEETRSMYHFNFYRHSWFAEVRRFIKETTSKS